MNDEIDYIACWSCGEVVSTEDIKHNDGFCPNCNQEIEFDDDKRKNRHD